MSEENKVKVKILAHVGHYEMGQIVEVPESHAKAMCEVRKRHDGHNLVSYQTAMLLADFEKIKAQPIDKGGLTQDELEALGEKNRVPTPADPLFEAKLAATKKASNEQQEKKNKEGKAAKVAKPKFEEHREESA